MVVMKEKDEKNGHDQHEAGPEAPGPVHAFKHRIKDAGDFEQGNSSHASGYGRGDGHLRLGFQETDEIGGDGEGGNDAHERGRKPGNPFHSGHC